MPGKGKWIKYNRSSLQCLVTVMAFSSASVKGPTMAGMQVMEGVLAGAVLSDKLAMIGAFSSSTGVLTTGSDATLAELLPPMLGTGHGPSRPQ
jgi:hypothetical protein